VGVSDLRLNEEVGPIRILAYDIETAPMITYTWGLWNQNIGINQIQQPSSVLCFAARWIDRPKNTIEFYSGFHHGHDAMIEAAWKLFDEADAVVTWNGKTFDETHMNREFLLADLGPPSPAYHVDLMAQVKKRFRFDSNKLDWVSEQIGSGRKKAHAGMQLWLDCMAGDEAAWKKFRQYNEQDVHLLVDNYNRLLPWLTLPNQNLHGVIAGCPTPGCPGTPHKRGFRTTMIGVYQRYHCSVCRRGSTSGKSIERSELRGE
jgi:hypothetical protein